jgi:hypothetical protein
MGMYATYYRLSPKQVAELETNSDAAEKLLEQAHPDGDSDTVFSLGKDWHVLHFLLTGEAEMPCDSPLSAVVAGGRETLLDVGYGPVPVLDPQEVARCVQLMEGLDKDATIERCDLQKLKLSHLYGAYEVDSDYLEDLWPDFEKLKAFYLKAADAGDAVLQVIG